MTVGNKRVLIIGAGISGLSLANVLQYHGVPFQIFERDISREIRPQGWSLTLHFSLNTLRNAMDPIKFATLRPAAAVNPKNPQAAPFALVDGNSDERKVTIGTASDGDAIRLNRKRLRDWLMQDISVTWNKAFESYELMDDGVQVTFTDGTVACGSVVVGADGVNSRVCRQLIGPDEFEKTTISYPVRVLACSYWIGNDLRKQIEERFSSAYMTAIANSDSDPEHTTCLFSSLTDVDLSRDEPFDTLWSISCASDDPLLGTDAERLQQAKDWVRKAQYEKTLEQLVIDTPKGTPVTPLHIRERSPHHSLKTIEDQSY
ncbi:hypothetical protein BJV82DRAFT_700855 [Fennellomyces sp. T-0311]|nr:hypothetical protein BJV82DRAFT_700855 [Fennellomyces sp. T-0311]